MGHVSVTPPVAWFLTDGSGVNGGISRSLVPPDHDRREHKERREQWDEDYAGNDSTAVGQGVAQALFWASPAAHFLMARHGRVCPLAACAAARTSPPGVRVESIDDLRGERAELFELRRREAV